MKRMALAAMLAFGVVGAVLWPAISPGVSAAEAVKLTGCLVGGQDDDDGYLLTNVGSVASTQPTGGTVAPGPVGTSGATAAIFYWLEDDDELAPHVGHRIEVDGDLAGDLQEGEIEIKPDDKWTELKIESDGRDLTARVPESLFLVSAKPGDDQKVTVLVRKVDVNSVRMLAATCQ
jgi:hypothetical protein